MDFNFTPAEGMLVRDLMLGFNYAMTVGEVLSVFNISKLLLSLLYFP